MHVQVREKDDASAGIVEKALAGLTVAPTSDSMLVVHIASKRMQRPLDDPKVPWQRVINAKGEVSPRPDADHQKVKLLEEGVVFDERGRVDLKRFRWRPRRV